MKTAIFLDPQWGRCERLATRPRLWRFTVRHYDPTTRQTVVTSHPYQSVEQIEAEIRASGASGKFSIMAGANILRSFNVGYANAFRNELAAMVIEG